MRLDPSASATQTRSADAPQTTSPGEPQVCSVRETGRAQANLIALIAALVVLATVSVVAIAVANGALADADREPLERQRASAIADRLVASDGELAARENVLDADALAALDAETFRERYAIPESAGVSVSVDGETLVETGEVVDGTTVQRVVLVTNRTNRTVTPGLDGRDSLTLPRRTPWISVDIAPSAAAPTTLRVNDRVLLHDPGGLTGSYRVTVSRRVTPRLEFEGADLDTGAVDVTYAPATARKVVLEVTVDVD